MPVKLSDALVKLARAEAEASDRSITAQIEHWATLGRSVEAALGHEDVLALKGADGNLQRAFPGPAARQAVYALLQQVATSTDRAELARTLTRERVVYQNDPSGSGAVMRIEPNGRRTVGRLEKRRFVASGPPRRRAAR